ncbi:MAG: type II toxin-antitoxin system RelE/ParE family toxin [Nitrospirae bacterium]|nr:type II toxin-antitoxin system RelE/ParE family toxin [Nitrospirota bacterium]MBI3392810.1 type II toxin-antitoxin system RelE/ParE family toxin [Nitrospirota bacterium]
MARATVRITANFHRNLEEIRQFLAENDAGRAFDALLDRVFDNAIPNLERFPELGKDFLARGPRSAEGLALFNKVKKRLGRGFALREYITGDTIVLYAVRGREVFLLCIRNHRQMSFDFRNVWR